MNKRKKSSLLLIPLICAMLFGIIPVQAHAKTLPAQIATLYATSDKKYDQRADKYISKNETLSFFADRELYPKSIKSSKKSVAAPGRTITKSYGNGYKCTFTYVKVKKTGTATISGKDGTTHKYKLTVKKYANPFSSITMNGEDITSRFKKKSVYTLSYQDFKKKSVTLNYAQKGDWYITVQAQVAGSTSASSVRNGSTVTVSQKGYTLIFHANNKKTGQYETCEIVWK